MTSGRPVSSAHSWAPLPDVMVRAAGLPFALVEQLALVDTPAHVRRAAAAADDVEARRGPLLGLVGDARRAASSPQEVNALRRAERRVRAAAEVVATGCPEAIEGAIAAWNAALEAAAEQRDALAATFEREYAQAVARLDAVTTDPLFRTAVLTNSPSAFDALVRSSPATSPVARRLAARYLQSFCAKCETAGVHGPLNFGRLEPDRGTTTIDVAGTGRAANRRVTISAWAATSLLEKHEERWVETGEAFVRRAAVLPPALPRSCRTPTARAVLEHADGTAPLRVLSRRLGAERSAVVDAARSLQAAGLAQIGVHLADYAADPAAEVAGRLLEETYAATELPWFLSWAARFERAPHDELRDLLAGAEARFERIARIPARREEGVVWGDRSIYWEEAVGNVRRLSLGGLAAERIVTGLQTPLDVVLTEAVAARAAAEAALRTKLLAARGHVLPAAGLSLDLPDYGTKSPAWSEVIPDPAVREVRLTRARLLEAGLIDERAASRNAVAAPDIMVAARSPDHLRRGELTVIVSEVHHHVPPLALPFLAFHPEAHAVASFTSRALHDLVAPATPAVYAERRTSKAVDLVPHGMVVVALDWLRAVQHARHVPLDEIELRLDSSERPYAAIRGTGERLAFLAQYPDDEPSGGILRHLALPAVDHRPLVLGSHTPRLSIDGVVFQRERWVLGETELAPVPSGCTDGDAFERVHVWRTALGMPRFVYALVGSEEKPVLVDFHSPLLLDPFLRHAARADRVVATEMLPTPDALWLAAAAGEECCCELRLTMLHRAH